MKRLLFIVVFLLQFFFIFANRPIKRSPVTDSLITELQTLPHDTTRLKLLEKACAYGAEFSALYRICRRNVQRSAASKKC